MLIPGVYPAAVTPFDDRGQIDMPAVARLLAWFEACGCKGAVLAGTNGEGPSLSAVEKRDLLRQSMPFRGKLDLILGIASDSIEEAIWLCNQAGREGAAAALVMPPSYFTEASEEGFAAWFLTLLDRTVLPILAYNLPQRTGVKLSPSLLNRLAWHERFLGVKDSSGERPNLNSYAEALPGKLLFVGNETLLLDALRAGWTGTISGAANVIPLPLVQVVGDWISDKREAAVTKFSIAKAAIEELRSRPQPPTNKALLHGIGVIPSPAVRLPLEASTLDEDLLRELNDRIGPLDRQSDPV